MPQLINEVGYLTQVISRKALTQNGEVIEISMALIRTTRVWWVKTSGMKQQYLPHWDNDHVKECEDEKQRSQGKVWNKDTGRKQVNR